MKRLQSTDKLETELMCTVICCRWLKVQSHLKTYHENLQLALEVSSIYQQADNTLFAINNMVQFPEWLNFLLKSEIDIFLTFADARLLF